MLIWLVVELLLLFVCILHLSLCGILTMGGETVNSVTSKRLIEFAPLRIPLSRRLETVGVILYIFVWCLAIIGPSVVLYVLLFTNYWILSIGYITWIVYDRNIGREGGRRSDLVRNSVLWKWYCNYFPIKLVKTAEFDPSKNYLFAFHPHGIFGSGLHGNFASEGTNVSQVFPGIKMHLLTLDYNFRIPFFREACLTLGGCSVSRESMNFLLSKEGGGNGVVLVPGGAREALYSAPGTDVVYLRKRKGFIKVAIQNGSPLVPIYSFGETDIYSQPQNPKGSWLRKTQEKCIDIVGAVPIFIRGRGIFQYTFGILPKRRPITSVVGAPIPVEKLANPSQEYIDQVHEQYVTALSNLFYAYRDTYGHPQSELIIN